MQLYELMKQYAEESGVPPVEEMPHPELGQSLGLLHSCLVEAGLRKKTGPGEPEVIAEPAELIPNHLSRFVVGFLPFNSVSTLKETNEILFQIFSFIKWLEKRDIPHGWQPLNFQDAIRQLTRDQERCLKLSHHLDAESGNTLEEPPPILNTLSDIFVTSQLDKPFVTLNGEQTGEIPRLQLDDHIMDLLQPGDHLDLVLGDTSERWVILEAGQVFPELLASGPAPAN